MEGRDLPRFALIRLMSILPGLKQWLPSGEGMVVLQADMEMLYVTRIMNQVMRNVNRLVPWLMEDV
jgi:hypothetical protein